MLPNKLNKKYVKKNVFDFIFFPRMFEKFNNVLNVLKKTQSYDKNVVSVAVK